MFTRSVKLRAWASSRVRTCARKWISLSGRAEAITTLLGGSKPLHPPGNRSSPCSCAALEAGRRAIVQIQASQRNPAVVFADQRRTREGQRCLLVAIDDAVNYVGIGGIGGGCNIDPEQDDAYHPSFQRNDVNIEIAIAFNLTGELAQVSAHASTVEAALENLAVAGLAGFVGRVMNGKSGLVQVALKLKPGLVHEVFVLRIAIFRRFLAQVGKQPNGFEVHVKDRVGFGQETSCIGRSATAQQHGGDDTAGDNQDNR